MTTETENLITSMTDLTDAYHGKIADIDNRITAKETEVATFLEGAEIDLKHFHEWTVTIDGDEDTFYPVVLAQDKTRFNDIEIVRSYNEDRGDAGVMSLHARFVGTGGSWGGNPCLLVPQFYTYRYQEAMARFGHVAHGRSAAFWLRGGGFQYCVRCTDPTADPQVYLTRTLILDHETDDHDWWVEPLTAVDPDMLPNDFGLTDAVGEAANQA